MRRNHEAMGSGLARRPRHEGAHVLAATHTLVGADSIGRTLQVLLFAEPLITLVGAGLDAPRHDIAVLQLRLSLIHILPLRRHRGRQYSRQSWHYE